MNESKPKGKMRYCCYCGEELGVYADYDLLDNCGKSECMQYSRDEQRYEREEAHRKLDHRRGWD
jgi:hypothetical protein